MTTIRRFFSLASASALAVALLSAPASRAAEPLLLQWGTIDTSSDAAQAESATLKAKVAKKAAATRKSRAAETRAAYIVQFPGPIADEWRTWLESATQVRGYLPEFAYLVWATPTEMDAIAANENVFWTGEWKKEYKTVCAETASPAKTTASATAAEARWMQVGSLLTGDDGTADLRARLAALGPVNLVAIEEHQQLEERFAFLSAQNDDLERARADLRKFIRDVNDTTTALFADTFKQVDAHFQALFTRLFGGGSARLALVDEENVLESGIDIVARPPGKKPQSVSLLSGGERTLTAVALLFALFRVKPSPFCLTDELDAALDDHNISRYLDMLADFTRDTQFLVITHNRQTIARADALYGVTMEKKGVSKFVSMRFRSDLPPATEPKGTP